MITITGTGFGDGATVTFGGVAATDVVVVNQTHITCTPPDHADGFVEVVVTNPDGTSGTLADAFIYTTLSVDPEDGPIAGGTTLTLTINDGGADLEWFPDGHTFWVFVTNAFTTAGIDLADPDLVLNPAIGGQVIGTRISDATVIADTLSGICGPTDVVVVDMDKLATSEPNIAFYLPHGYLYQLNAPVVTDVLPVSGPARGGTHVVLAGTFSPTTCSGGGTTEVTFGDVPLTSLGCTVDTITGITGEHDAGVVDVVVINPDGQTVTLPGAYTYVNAPTVTAIDPDHGPDTGGTDVTITGADFQDGAAVMLRGLLFSADGLSSEITIADAFDVIVLDDATITATTSGNPAVVCDVVVTNPDGQRGTLERGYTYEGWWEFVGDFEDVADPGWLAYGPWPGVGWATEPLLPVPVDGWWMSTAAYGGAVMVVASSRPKDPRRWNQIATFATGSAAMLGGSPGVAGVFHNRLVYAASDYTVGTTAPPIRIYDGSFDRELCRLPKTAALAQPIAILSLLVANGTIYLSSFDSGTSSADWTGRVFALDLNTAVLTPVGAVFATGHLPYALGWHNGQLWCGTHRQATSVAGKICRIRPDLPDATWTDDHTWGVGYNTAALYSWQGTLYAGLTAPAGSFGLIVTRATDGSWNGTDAGSVGTATANNGYLAFCAFKGALYASYWNQDTTPVATIRKTTDGVTWTTVYTGSGGTARPFIVLAVDHDELFAIGGGAHLTVAILRSPDGATWVNLTDELPDPEKTALPAVAALVF